MSHANTTAQFQDLFNQYPCGPDLCLNARDQEVGYCCRECRRLRNRTIKVCDSGVFTKQGRELDYQRLFETYTRMGCEYGIIIDFLRNAKATLKSAKLAMEEFRALRPDFKLVGVAQGRSVKEYVECYEALQQIGFHHIAIGGMLNKRINTAHYAYVRADGQLLNVLRALREGHPNDWLFALGCYHPKRHLAMEQLRVFGSDYKGWIFHYQQSTSRFRGHARRSRFAQVRTFLSQHLFDSPLYLNGATAEVAQAFFEGRKLVVVACGSRKVWSMRPETGRIQAQDAYTGPLFRAGRRYAETASDRWVILSAKHGLINPTHVIQRNYDQKLRHGRTSSMSYQLRTQVLDMELHKFSSVVVVGGQAYVDLVKEAYAGTGIPVQPFEEKPTRIGVMIHDLQRISAATARSS